MRRRMSKPRDQVLQRYPNAYTTRNTYTLDRSFGYIIKDKVTGKLLSAPGDLTYTRDMAWKHLADKLERS